MKATRRQVRHRILARKCRCELGWTWHWPVEWSLDAFQPTLSILTPAPALLQSRAIAFLGVQFHWRREPCLARWHTRCQPLCPHPSLLPSKIAQLSGHCHLSCLWCCNWEGSWSSILLRVWWCTFPLLFREFFWPPFLRWTSVWSWFWNDLPNPGILLHCSPSGWPRRCCRERERFWHWWACCGQ